LDNQEGERRRTLGDPRGQTAGIKCLATETHEHGAHYVGVVRRPGESANGNFEVCIRLTAAARIVHQNGPGHLLRDALCGAVGASARGDHGHTVPYAYSAIAAHEAQESLRIVH